MNGDIFSQPAAYSGAQKAAVLIKLQQTREQVQAGAGIRDTRETENQLTEKIAQLQDDPEVRAFLASNLDEQAASIVGGDPRLAKVVDNAASALCALRRASRYARSSLLPAAYCCMIWRR